MSTTSTLLESATQWDAICYPVKTVELRELLSSPHRIPTDRKRAIVGEPNGEPTIFAIQSSSYTLIPNSVVREVAERVLPGHQLRASFTERGDFALSLVMPDEINQVLDTGRGTVQDRLFRSLILTNSYNGKTPFGLQGSATWEQEQKSGVQSKMRVSYFREICTNGLMGWADEYYSLDEYMQWLAAGKPHQHKRVQEEKTRTELVEVSEHHQERKTEILVERRFHHIGLSLEGFKRHLETAFRQFLRQQNSLTTQVYQRLSRTPLGQNREKVFADTKLPRQLAQAALQRLAEEEVLLQTPANLWLAYNAANFALFKEKTSLTINERFRLDEQLFHRFAELAM